MKLLSKWVRRIEEKHHTSLSTSVVILHYANRVYEALILHSRKRLGENSHYLLICGYVLELHNSSLHHVLDLMVFYLYVLWLFMKDRIL
jgi:hypothetical protein